jgi:Zn-dependent peptidase ImmA (M78 family)
VHELGHRVCQCLEGTTVPLYCRDKALITAADRALEREANVFAAELLMPDREVREEFSRSGELAERFRDAVADLQLRLAHDRP